MASPTGRVPTERLACGAAPQKSLKLSGEVAENVVTPVRATLAFGEEVLEHLVKFRSAEGRDGQHTAASLDDALRFVERLRNNEDATDVHVFRMHEVPIEFKTYYKVELGPGEDGKPESEAGAVVEAPRPPAAPASGSADTEAEANGRRLFSRS